MARLELGGYLPLESLRPSANSHSLHADAIALNSGRNALRYLLSGSSFERIYLPSYICGSVTDVLTEMALPFELYGTSTTLEPLLGSIEPGTNDCVIVVNYFGVVSKAVRGLVSSLPNTIVDNTQAFFSECRGSVGTFVSPRKFFGVPDGGYAYASTRKTESLVQDDSTDRWAHLKLRREQGAAAGYSAYRENESRISTLGLRGMSASTAGVLEQLDYSDIARVRTSNFNALHSELASLNELEMDTDTIYGPMAYPLLLKNSGTVREALIARSIFVPRYWPDMPAASSDTGAHYLANNLLPLPIDQNVGESELTYLLEHLRELL
ncbi:MAG: hypothetical protein ACI87W_002597 [Halieaceae bacterium]|jgi:hypothetical protein